jgi:hypothetical protein
MQNDSEGLNTDIKIPQEAFDDIILSLEFAINDINKEQNKFYIIEEIENIIEKLKNYSNSGKKTNNLIPKPKFVKSNSMNSNIQTIEISKNNTSKANYSPLKPQINESQISNSYNDESNQINRLNDENNQNVNNIRNLKNININDINNNSKTLHQKMKSSSSLSMTQVPKRKDRSPASTRYTGPRINGKKEGKGIYIYPNGCRYEGYFKNDKKEGSGIFYYKNGDKYVGNFEDGNYEGNGIFYFNNGDRYEGQFEKNKYSGRGKYFYHNGDYFDGFWMDDKKTGEGIYYYENGDKTVGKYYNGKPYGKHIRYCQDGRTFQINY